MAKTRLMWIVLIGILLAPATARAQDEVVYYHTDAVGSVRMITDEAGAIIARYDYTPFGQLLPQIPPAPTELLQFTGKEHDLQTSLDYFIARDFMSLTGRFTTPDDPSYMNPFNPQSMNRFAYAHNNPFRWVDPTGHQICPTVYCEHVNVTAPKPDGLETGLLSWLSRNFFGLLDAFTLTTPLQAPGMGEADQPLVDRSPDTAVLAAAAVVGAPGGARRIAGRLTQGGLEHIVLRHWATSGAQGASKFLGGTTGHSLKGLINQALEQGAVRANTAGRAGHIVEYDFGRQIGVSMSGEVATRLRVVLSPNGTVITAFPF